jgi:hypothetical protein
MYQPGIRVIITMDCRQGSPATGQLGVYEGDFLYEDSFENPRIRLDDGTCIWGCECWWEPYNGQDLESSQRKLWAYLGFEKMLEILREASK